MKKIFDNIAADAGHGHGGYNFTGYVKNAQDNARQVALEMIYQNMNRPSVCFWGLFSEILVNDGRFTDRHHSTVDVKVYTNQKDATLYVNGKKIARQQADDIHRIIFKDVQLSEGDNKMEFLAFHSLIS
ncbi:MAG: DUF4982 domain-containing protein [Prevotella sp.]|nr:DUF4982 domain-containing protein [Prevotella sp.]